MNRQQYCSWNTVPVMWKSAFSKSMVCDFMSNKFHIRILLSFAVASVAYLSLSEGDWVELVSSKALVICILQQCHGGVCSGGQDKDERGTTVGISIALGQIKRRRFHKLLPQLFHDKCSDGRHNLWKNPSNRHKGKVNNRERLEECRIHKMQIAEKLFTLVLLSVLTLSGRMARSTIIRWKSFRVVCHGSGSSILWGSFEL